MSRWLLRLRLRLARLEVRRRRVALDAALRRAHRAVATASAEDLAEVDPALVAWVWIMTADMGSG